MTTKPLSTSEPRTLYHGNDGDIKISADCESLFIRFITERTGIVLQAHQLPNLHATLIKACAHFSYSHPERFLATLKSSTGLNPELNYLITGITVGESYFFRDSAQMDLLRAELLPEIIRRKRAARNFYLRIWSAGCSQGQEIYSLAFLLQELLPDIGRWQIDLLGTDINNELLAKATQGCYSEWSFRALPPHIKQQWFMEAGNGHQLHSKIKAMVRFAYHNLASPSYASVLNGSMPMDVILCRNVFIYLNNAAIRHAMSQYNHCLADHGILLLGASDPVDYKHTALTWIQSGQATFFKKTPAAVAPAVTQWQAQRHLAPVLEEKLTAPPKQTSTGLPCDTDRLQASNADLLKCVQQANWQGALEMLERCMQNGEETCELWLIKAQALQGTGQIALARRACERSLQLNPINKHAYLLLGMILAKQRQDHEADVALRKALYLDHTFVAAHYEVALLKIRTHRLQLGIKSMETTLKLARQCPPDDELPNRPGLTYHELSNLLSAEIAWLREVVDKT